MSNIESIEQDLINAARSIADAQDELGQLKKIMSTPTQPAPLTPSSDRFKDELFAICVGHSRKNDQGAISVGGTSEWNYNNDIAIDLQARLKILGVPSFIVSNYQKSDYTLAINYMASVLRNKGATAGMELHFNSYDGSADEEEYLYWHSSSKSRLLAECVLNEHVARDPDPRTRGAKPKSDGRGSYALKATPCPFIITEPFFGDNAKEWEQWGSSEGMDRLVEIYAAGIVRYYESV